MDAREELRARLVEAGLDLHADALVAMASDSIRLRPVGPQPRAVAYRHTPVEVIDAGVVAIAAGLSHTLALLRDGSVLAWGSNESGELGDGTRMSRSVPGPVPGLDGVVAITASGGNSFALQGDGSVLVWGDHHGGRIGAWTTTQRRAPVPVEGLDGSVRALFGAHAIMDDGTVLALGSGRAIVVPGLDADVVAIASGGGHGLAISSDGSLTVWGRERDPADPSGRMVWTDPHPLPGCEGPIAAIAAGAAGHHQSFALTPAGEVLAWEPSPLGQTTTQRAADGAGVVLAWEPSPDTARRRTPAGVTGLNTAVVAIAVACGQDFALRADGTVVAWGSNFSGDLGDGTLLSRKTPGPVSGLPPVRAIAPGAALTHDGAVYAWGGQLPPADAAELEVQMPIGVSKLGGCPDLPADVSWPTREARPMAFVAQVELGDVASLDSDGALPPAGLLSFFTLPIDWAEGSEAGRVIYTEPQTPLTRTPLPAGLPADERFAPVRLEPERELTAAPRGSAILAPLGLSREQRLAYEDATWDLWRDAPMHRMLGHPQLIQNDPRNSNADLCLLLQVDSDQALAMEWGDLGRLCYWLDHESLQERRFDRFLFDYQA